ncbi:hypothetical protein ISN44_As07g011320 [Arabidopsis suecica]|uniref:Uncharacterized protein n=1 Tax=Arabidopsis suecica TaxID=45249 RepID=A0A8T2BZK4_ARASU|nr:hypothetical protein ISN44_As07g011320 [Arabidopsis suecica]
MDTQVSNPNLLRNYGVIGEDVVMTEKELAEDDLVEDQTSSSEQVDEALEETEEEAALAHDGVVETEKRARTSGVLKGVSSKKQNA